MQLKLVHNIVATNKKKYDWKIIESPKCRYCLELDTVIHFFWECNHSQNIIRKCLCTLKLFNLKFLRNDYLFGKQDVAVDNVALIIKYHIYILRIHDKKFVAQNFINEVRYRWIADSENMSRAKMECKWAIIPKGIFDNCSEGLACTISTHI